jgi:hypothetical protein
MDKVHGRRHAVDETKVFTIDPRQWRTQDLKTA